MIPTYMLYERKIWRYDYNKHDYVVVSTIEEKFAGLAYIYTALTGKEIDV